MSLAPMIGDTGGSRKNKTSVRKKILLSQYQNAKKPDVTGKNTSWCMTCHTLMLVCMYHKRKCLWRGRLMSLLCSVCDMYNLLSLYYSPKSRWWLPSAWNPDCPIVWNLWSTTDHSHTDSFSGIITYIHYASAFTNHVTITLWEGIVRLVQCCLWSPISCVCVQEQGCWTSAPCFVTASLGTA